MKTSTPPADDPELQIAPLIDCVFQLLIFFMVSASLVKSEGDLGIKLPGMNQTPTQVDMPDEQIIEVRSTGQVFLNGREFGDPRRSELPDLIQTLVRYRLASNSSKNKPMITVWAEDRTRHQRVIDVLDACSAAGIEYVTFSGSSPQ
ncbi:MAG: biopolymer transporter ExbD [Lentisphaerae bacterium]|nr:biopolymer transporter ExbD [Lentisphaerota bacterium]